ncbi:TIGR03943 family putative permease subunit [Streptomyces sennicomposti]|uniref:TIGR03943 family putative permease subunit n=1 Tax=Streptomyces sennicomposti TaxID=2873384 RepID=UPI001CA6D767|nr:TIGR03943 family protein [Streptomyces sennicomposti]MBY8869157.1 TIGR03943 family protein [Streptomyces sennicomposti]
MRRPLQVTLLVLSGLGLLHASLFTDLFLRYVKEGMRPLLIASGVLLLLLGVAEAWATPAKTHGADHPERGHGHEGDVRELGRGGDAQDPGDEGGAHDHGGHGHDHSTVPRVAWLLFLPALSLLFYAPPALGAYTASREAPKAVASGQRHFDPLPATSPLPMTLTDFTRRVQQDPSGAVRGRSVLLTGFVTPDKGGRDTWYLTRIILSCCAADAQSVKVRIHGTPALPANTWVSVTGAWHPGGTLGTASAPADLDARAVRRIERPINGYTDDLPLVPSR